MALFALSHEHRQLHWSVDNLVPEADSVSKLNAACVLVLVWSVADFAASVGLRAQGNRMLQGFWITHSRIN